MNVHICSIDDKHIVPRMMSWLRDSLGWSMSERPRPSATLNYYGPYLSWAAVPGVDTLKAGWFTHYEPDTAKGEIWQQASRIFDLRCTAANLYLDQLSTSGLTAKVTAGVDQEHFAPKTQRSKKSKLPRVGLSGVGQPRKGVALAERLTASQMKVELVAAGRDWGEIPSTWIPYEEMPAFYNSLTVYICTAVIEGIPAPPLEALACGVKVVVPAGVGMMDELPETEGVRHYTAGDSSDLVRAVRQALADEASRETLRDVVAPYTVKAWCESHRAAVESFLAGREKGNE